MLLLCMSLLLSPCLCADLVDTLAGRPDAATLVQLVQKAGLVDTLKRGTFTILAPTDAAFAKVDAATLSTLLTDTAKLASVLAYHVIPGKVPSNTITDELTPTTLQGSKVRFNVYTPPISTSPKTVTLNGGTISVVDVVCDNGVIHFIDDVMLPVEKSVVELIAEDPELSTLLSLVTAAGIAFEFQESPITVFAPTNAAFAAIPGATVTKLISDIPMLQETLEFHAVSDTLFSLGLYQGEREDTFDTDQDNIKISVAGDQISVSSVLNRRNSGKVVAADIQATNGVIHKIDGVLIPRRVDDYLKSPN